LINNKTIQKISKLTKLSNSVYSVVKKKILWISFIIIQI
jgi:hypothetical protein